jgi:hypothetical protein
MRFYGKCLKMISFTRKSLVLSPPIFTKLTNAQEYYLLFGISPNLENKHGKSEKKFVDAEK